MEFMRRCVSDGRFPSFWHRYGGLCGSVVDFCVTMSERWNVSIVLSSLTKDCVSFGLKARNDE